MNSKCRLCYTPVKLFHKGVRDNVNIDVMKCPNCGLLQLSSFEHIEGQYYEDEQMRKNQYNGITGLVEDESWESWIEETMGDDDRRYLALSNLCKNGNVLDFGCGNGGFLRRVRKDAKSVIGIELDSKAREMLNYDNIHVYDDLERVNGQFDVITMFQVIEHLDDPDYYLDLIYRKLKPGGKCIIETPNAEDALISYYQCEAFMNFTFWSLHLMLYNSLNLASLAKRHGFCIINNEQIQRYPLSNHIVWLKEGRPSGHKILKEIDDIELKDAYEKLLRKNNMCDTLFIILGK